MKVLFLSIYDPCKPSGPSNHLRNLSEALSQIGVEVHVLVCGSITKDVEINGVKIHYARSGLTGVFGQGFLFSLFSIGTINRVIRAHKIDIVHGQSPSSFGYAMFRSAKCPFVVTLHGTSFGEISSYSGSSKTALNFGAIEDAMILQPLTAFLTSIEYKYADKVIAVSNYIAREAAGYYRLPDSKVVTIQNGINLPYLSHMSGKKRAKGHLILFVGRLIWRKGVSFLVDAMPQILRQYSDAKLIIVGMGNQETTLRNRVKKHGIESAVQFLSNVSRERLFSLYDQTDVYVQPSLYEPFSIATLEAMSMEKPVVASRVGGVLELITDGVEGLLVNPGDSLQLAGAIINFFSDSSLKERLGKNARMKVEKEYTWKTIANKTAELYKDLLNIK